jgi:hypothetical protein
VLTALVATGCQPSGPGDYLYTVGLARVGDTYHLVAPLCDDERLVGVEVYDNVAVGETNPSPGDTSHTFWKAEQPARPDVERGIVAIGDDAGFRQVTVPAGSKAAFPTTIGIGVTVSTPNGTQKTGDVVKLAEVPTYPAGDDPAAVKYVIDDDESRPQLLTRAEIGKQYTRCARDNA